MPRGVTSLEIMIAVAVLGIVFGMSGLSYSRLQRMAASVTSDREVTNVLATAARRARSGVGGTSWGVYIPFNETTRKTPSMVVFAGSSYAARDTSKDLVFGVSDDIAFTSVDFSGAAADTANSHEIVFSSLTGTTAQYGSVTVTYFDMSQTLTIPANGIPVR